MACACCTMDHRAATQQARSGLVVRESKLFQDGGGVSVVCSRKKCCRVSFLVAALVQGGDTPGGVVAACRDPPLLVPARPDCSGRCTT